MSHMTRLSFSKTVSYVPRRFVSSKPQSPLQARLAARIDAPSGVLRTASQFLYANFFRRNAVFLTGVIGAAVVVTGAYDYTMDALWEYNNQGKLFKDVIPKRFPNLPPNTEPEGGDEDSGEVSAEDEPTGSDEDVEREKEESGQKEDEQPAETDANKNDETKQKEEDNKKGKGNTADKNEAKGQTPVQRLESTEGAQSNQHLKDHQEHDTKPNTGTADSKGSESKAADAKAQKGGKKADSDDSHDKSDKKADEKADKGKESKAGAGKDEEKKAQQPAASEDKSSKPQRTTEGNSRKPEHKQVAGKETEQKPHNDQNKLFIKPKDLSQHQDQSTPKGQSKNDKPAEANTGAESNKADQKEAGKQEQQKQAGGVKHNDNVATTSAATGDVENKGKKAPTGGNEKERAEAKEAQRDANKKPASEKK